MATNTSAFAVEYRFAFDFERQFDHHSKMLFMRNNPAVPYVTSAVYLAIVFGGRWLMKDRAPFKIKMPLAIWSTCLAIFSILGECN